MINQFLKDLLSTRYSVRGFNKQVVADELLKDIFATAQLAISNCNTQPWMTFVASGKVKDKLKQALVEVASSGESPNADFSYFGDFKDQHKKRQVACAMALYDNTNVAREDKVARKFAMMRNFEFFDAPHVAFICMPKSYGVVNALDIGSYLQTISLVMQSYGIASCVQGALGFYPDPIKEFLSIPEEQGVIVGISFGYEDKQHPANKTRTTRASINDMVVFYNE